MKRSPSDWYERMGVAPPEMNEHLTEDQVEKIFEKIRSETKHGKWVQQGDRLTCRQCNPPHTSEPVPELRTTHILSGTDSNGLPVLTKLKNI